VTEVREILQTYIAEAPTGNKGNIPDATSLCSDSPGQRGTGKSPGRGGNCAAVTERPTSLAWQCCAATQNLPPTPGTGLPFILQIVLLLLMPLAVVYLISVLGLAIDLIQTALRNAGARNRAPEAGQEKASKPHIGNFSQ
jgi:hypothetical protein